MPEHALSRSSAQRIVAALLVAVTLTVAGVALRGDANPDWAGYEDMYDNEGAWLGEFGRDPLFVALIRVAAETFGRHGYEDFRSVVLVVFVLFAAWLALTLRVSPLLVATAVLAMLLTKATIQIREGLAFLAVIAAVVRIIRGKAIVPTYGLLVVAALTHSGTAPYIAAVALTHWMMPRRILLVASLAAALVAGFYAAGLFTSADEVLAQLGLGRQSEEGALWKWLYWAAYGGGLFVLARELTRDGHRFGIVLAWGLLPFLYVLVVYLLATGQPLPAVALVSRMIATAAAVAILVLLLRSRSPLLVFCASAFLLVDQARTIYVAVTLLS